MSDRAAEYPLPPGIFFETAFNQAAIGMALVSPDGRWLQVNRSICELTGYAEEELLRLRFQDITHPDDLDLDLENVGKLSRGEIPTYQMEKRYFHKNGRVVWVLSSVSLARNAVQDPLFFISQIQDITSRKEDDEQLDTVTAEIKRLRSGLLKVCAWTKRIEIDGRWIPLENFLSETLHFQLTHGMSEEAVRLFGPEKPR